MTLIRPNRPTFRWRYQASRRMGLGRVRALFYALERPDDWKTT